MTQECGSHGSWEAIASHPMFPCLINQVQSMVTHLREVRRPLTLLAFHFQPEDASRLPDRLLEGCREQTHQAIAGTLRDMALQHDRPDAPFSVGVGSICFVLLPGRDDRNRDQDLTEILDTIARIPWMLPRGVVGRRIRLGLASWDPTMASDDARLALGRAFEALVMATFGMADPLPPALPVHPHDQVRLAINAWAPARRRSVVPVAGMSPQTARKAVENPGARTASTRTLRRQKARASKPAARPWWKIW